MKILLVVPYCETHYFVPPIGLGYLATSLRRGGFSDVKIIDGVKEKLDVGKFKALIKEEKPDAVGFQVFSSDVDITQKYLKSLKSISPKTRSLVGGAHPSGVKSGIFDDFPQLDFAFIGEAEKGLPLLFNKIESNETSFEDVPGLIWKKDKKVVVNGIYLEEDLDSLGFPAWDLMDIRTYPQAPQGAVFRNWPIAPLLTSRGCPYNCTYCANKLGMGQRIRARSIRDVIEEIKLLCSKYGAKEIHIIDDTFTSKRERVVEFCNQLLKNKIKVTISLPNGVRLNTLDNKLLNLMKNAGVYSFAIGIESGSDKVLKDMRKGLTTKLIREKLALISSVGGITTTGFFIVGYPTESRETILQTIKFAKSLPLSRAHFSTFLPLPGTDITERLKREGVIKKIDWSKLFYTDAPFPPAGMTSKEQKSLQRRAFLEFYLRPKIILGMISEIRSWTHFKSLFKRAWDYAFVS